MKDMSEPGSGRAMTDLQKVATIGSIATTVLTGAVALISALFWIYGELNSMRGLIYGSKAEIAEMRATVGAVSKTVERIDIKLDRIPIPAQK